MVELVARSAAAVAVLQAEVPLVEAAETSEEDVVDLIGVVAAVDEEALPLVVVVSDRKNPPDKEN